jgi:hypothetical protein
VSSRLTFDRWRLRVVCLGLAGAAAYLAILPACVNNHSTYPQWTYSVCIDTGCGGPGAPAGQDTACGGPNECPCLDQGDEYCGYCPSAPLDRQCSYCPSGTTCSADACNPSCTPPPSGMTCTVDCNNGRCCYDAFPVCCGNPNYCGTDETACASAGTLPASSQGGSSGGGSCGIPSGGCPSGYRNSTLTSGCCSDEEVGPCSAGGSYATCTDGCGNGWYEYQGRIYGPCAGGDQGCLQQAAQRVVAACEG